MMMLIMLASILGGFVAGTLYGLMDRKNHRTKNIVLTPWVVYVFAGAFLGMLIGGFICGITALVRYFA